LQDEGVAAQLSSFHGPHVEHGLEIAFFGVGVAEGGLVYGEDLGGEKLTLKMLWTLLKESGDSSFSRPSSDSGFLKILFFLAFLNKVKST
jgi:hypothetical protein